jgi:hypothetical protein
MRSTYFRVVALYIHFFWELTFLHPCSVRIKLFLAFSYLQELLPSFSDAPRRCNRPMHDRALSRLSVLNLNALALLILKATGLSRTCELPQLFLGHQMA